MARLVIRLHPSKPISASDFTKALIGLKIEAFEMSVNKPDGNPDENPMGTATYIAPDLNPSPGPLPLVDFDANTRIVQHFGKKSNQLQPLLFDRIDFATATAVIKIPPGAEYKSADVILRITRGTGTIIHNQKYYNVPRASGNSLTPKSFQGITKTSLHLALPIAGQQLEPGDAFVNLPEDGLPPNYNVLRKAVLTVLDNDPGGIVDVDGEIQADTVMLAGLTLTLDACKHIAYEIAWNRSLFPLPDPPNKLDILYTGPYALDDDKERDRQLFEGELQKYYALHNAEAEKLTQYVFALAAAAWGEVKSTDTKKVFYSFPVTPGIPTPDNKQSETQLILAGVGANALNPPFTITANFFYALAADLPVQVAADKRFQIAIRENEVALKEKFAKSIENLIIDAPVGLDLTQWQAVRRLLTLFLFNESTVPIHRLATGSAEQSLIQHWLDTSKEDINEFFWDILNIDDKEAHLHLLLRAFTRNDDITVLLSKAILAVLATSEVSAVELGKWTESDWRAIVDPSPPNNGNIVNIPPFISPGTDEERIRAFLRYVRQFFEAIGEPVTAPVLNPMETPELDRWENPLDSFLQIEAGFSFDTWDGTDASIEGTLNIVFPDDPKMKKKFRSWLRCIKGMLELTTGIAPLEMQFSVIEALWARGLASKEVINKYTEEQLKEALTGSVAYDFASDIWVNAGSVIPNTPPGPSGFKPVNPDGSLVNCIPPKHRSPLGPVAYLFDMLNVTENSSCENPIVDGAEITLASLLLKRRGSLGNLMASKSNLEIPLPLIDIVNESMENMVSKGLNHGIVYDTSKETLGGHELASITNPNMNVQQHDPETLFEALPEHATPATPTAEQGAYDILKSDFSAPDLPYSQALDINCSYLNQMNTSRFNVSRLCRKDITEFVLDPDKETDEFQKHLWRYPVRIETAIAYFCMSPEEYEFFTGAGVVVPQKGRKKKSNAKENTKKGLPLHCLFGYSEKKDANGNPWINGITKVHEFLSCTGLNYCEFYELWKAKIVNFHIVKYGDKNREPIELSMCEPCCLDNLEIVFDTKLSTPQNLYQLNLFIRLWRKLQGIKNAAYSFEQLCDISEVLGFFDGANVNPDFIRQLVAFQMFRDDFQLLLTDGSTPELGQTGAERMHLLAFWAHGASKFTWAVQHLLDQIQQYAQEVHGCDCREPEFIKLLERNLDDLALLAGFEHSGIAGNHYWHEHPTKTLRFAEILAKIYASKSTVGDLLFLFTANPHIQGDDPFPLQTNNEAKDSPFGLPDDENLNSLWALRKKLLSVNVMEEKAAGWTWSKIESSLRDDFGMDSSTGFLLSIRQHFFPNILNENGIPVSPMEQRYSVPLAIGSTSAPMWNTPDNGPFRYDVDSQQLYTVISLSNEDVLSKLARIRQLNADERKAVQDLYFLPRLELARFAFLFSNYKDGERKLIEEQDERSRWSWFQNEFAICKARCEIIAEHLAGHMGNHTHPENKEILDVTQLILRSLWGDENMAVAPWEDDDGATPNVTWQPTPSGSAYAALLGLVGTGMQAEYLDTEAILNWRDVRGGTEVFGISENKWNAPVPTVLPAMDLTLPANLTEFISIHNGLAFANPDNARVGGTEAFTLNWKGLVLIEKDGSYAFMAGAPTAEGEIPDFEMAAHFHQWRIQLSQGQKTWVLLSHEWENEEAPSDCSTAIRLKKGMYELSIELERNTLSFNDVEDVCPQTTGFQLKYNGPDSGKIPTTIPFNKLFQQQKNAPLGQGVALSGIAQEYLESLYTSTVRDIRRTYQRVYKALLFAHRLDLSAKRVADDGQSELGYMLANPKNFSGQSYYKKVVNYTTHKANFDFNFLPVNDNYYPQIPSKDQRVEPSDQRKQAMFDWWERLFDYSVMRRESNLSPERPVWLLFHESKEIHPDDVSHLLRHMGVNANHAGIVQRFNPDYELNTAPHIDDLNDDRWAIRAWKSELWVRQLEKDFYPKDIREARPELWASIDPNAIESTFVVIIPTTESGNANLTKFYRDGCIENDAPLRYENIKKINDGLRLRGHKALLSFLTHFNRVALPSGGFATEPKQLGELLLIDVEAGLCQKASRIEEAVTAIQLFVQRARLGLEFNITISSEFTLAWDRHFANFRIWEVCKRRQIYRENWIEWNELQRAQQNEAYQFLESEIRKASLTIPVPGGLAYWNGARPPEHPGMTLLQNREPSIIETLNPAREGIGLMGTPDINARPSWLAPLKTSEKSEPQDQDPIEPIGTINAVINPEQPNAEFEELPLWLQAAVRLGTKFIRVAAAGIPPASTNFDPKCEKKPISVCCEECGEVHPALLDEYYFWIEKSSYYEDKVQNADWGATEENGQTDWHNPEKLPGLLQWNKEKMVHLKWCRVHNGEFLPVRQSYEGIMIDSPAELVLLGRLGDSLHFECKGGKTPEGFPAPPPPPGFRYDIAIDEAITLPQLVGPVATELVAGLPSFPYFAWFCPGAPLLPPSMFSPAITVAGHLRAHCRFEAALKWYELFYNPLLNDNSWSICEKDIIIESARNKSKVSNTEEECCCASDPVDVEEVKQRAILLYYLENMTEWGNALLRKNTPEAFQQARLNFDTAAKILGISPDQIVVKEAPDVPQIQVKDFKPDCAPLNPRLICLYSKVDDCLSLIHACLNAKRLNNGRQNLDIPYFGNSQIRECWKTISEVCVDESDWCTPQSHYRFIVLVNRAKEMASEVRSLGAALLAAYEKGDAEYLGAMRTLHERQILNLTLDIRQQQWRESDWQLQALEKTKEIAITRRQYYSDLISNGLKNGEIQYEALTNISQDYRLSANVAEGAAGIMGIIPDIYAGFPVTQTHLPIGLKLAEATLMTVGRVLNALAERANTDAGLELTGAGWNRREDEWKYQVEVLDIEIQQIERQILAADRRRDIALRELNNYQQQLENVGEVHNFLRDKFSSHSLYLWMQQETAAMHYQQYEMALHCAGQAQKAFNFERGHTARQFITKDIWDNLHEGLLSGERLQLAVRQMEKAYYDENEREYELTKHISLRLHSPRQLLQLRETGYCEVELPEWLFDLDYPGQYMRRIKNVTLTIPCVTGPYTGIHCRLTLLSSSTRIDPSLFTVASCCDDEGCKNGYEAISDDHRFVKMYAATEAIATSAGQNDSGMFELNFRDERYLPFEYSGAVSRWRIELPHENNFFDLNTLTDVLMHLNYSAREGGEILRMAANECAQNHVPGDGVRFIEVRKEMSDAWHLFSKDENNSRELPLRYNRHFFPFIPGKPTLWSEGYDLFIETDSPYPTDEVTVQFQVDLAYGDLVPDECDGDVLEIHCIRSVQWPELYYGSLDLRLGPLPVGKDKEFGKFKFPKRIGKIVNVYLLNKYSSI